MSQPKRLADRRGHGNLSFLANARRPPSPPPTIRTAISILPPYDFTPDDLIGEPHHPGKPLIPDRVVRTLESLAGERLQEASKLTADTSVTEDAEALRFQELRSTLRRLEGTRFQLFMYAMARQTTSASTIISVIEAQQKRDDRLGLEQKEQLTPEQVKSYTLVKHDSHTAAEALHLNTNIRACNSSLEYRRILINALHASIFPDLRKNRMYTLEQDTIEELCGHFGIEAPEDEGHSPWPKKQRHWRKREYRKLYRREDSWLAQGREQYGHVDDERPASP